MIINGIIRTKEFGTKKIVQVDGYRKSDDLEACRRIIQQQFPYAVCILFSVPDIKIEELERVE